MNIRPETVKNTGVATIEFRAKFQNGQEFRAVQYHQTIIFKEWFNQTGHFIQIDSGGWQTATTKRRINASLPEGLILYQSDFDWYLDVISEETGQTDIIPFHDNMILRCLYGGIWEECT